MKQRNYIDLCIYLPTIIYPTLHGADKNDSLAIPNGNLLIGVYIMSFRVGYARKNMSSVEKSYIQNTHYSLQYSIR